MPDRDSPIDPEAPFLKPLVEKLCRHPKRIVFPEGHDLRILRVAEKLAALRAAAPIVLGEDDDAIRQLAEENRIDTRRINILRPEQAHDFDHFCERFITMERYRHHEVSDPKPVVSKPHNFAAMMTQYGQADAIVGGNQLLPAAFFRAIFQMIKPQDHCECASAVMILVNATQPNFGKDGVLFLTDCGVTAAPSVEQIAVNTVEAGKFAALLLGRQPRVALLSHSNKGSAHSPSADRMIAATALAREKARQEYADMEIDGELQVDVALVSEVSQRKGRPNFIHGEADVLVFPDLDAAHIAGKLLQHLANAQCYGPFILGLARPAAQVSQVASPQTIFGTAVAAGVKAIKYREIIAAESE